MLAEESTRKETIGASSSRWRDLRRGSAKREMIIPRLRERSAIKIHFLQPAGLG